MARLFCVPHSELDRGNGTRLGLPVMKTISPVTFPARRLFPLAARASCSVNQGFPASIGTNDGEITRAPWGTLIYDAGQSGFHVQTLLGSRFYFFAKGEAGTLAILASDFAP